MNSIITEMLLAVIVFIAITMLIFMYVFNDIQSHIDEQAVECVVKGTLAPKYPEPISHLKKSVILECEEKNTLTNVISGDKVKVFVEKK
jgi:hypothetical protein